MLKVLLVDDEPYVLEGLKISINWTAYGFRICGEATNGEDALELVRLSNPDLVITDIRMPVMDGLEFIRLSKERLRSSAKFVILSGYDDFSYAKEAMLYNVSDYLLKPIDSEELESVVSKLASLIKKEKRNMESTNKQLAFVLNLSLRRLFSGETKKSLLNRISMLLGVKPDDEVICVLFSTEAEASFDGPDKTPAELRQQAKKCLETALGPAFCFHLFEDENGRLGIFFDSNMPYFENVDEFVHTLIGSLGGLPLSVTAAISSVEKGPAGLARAYRQAVDSLNYKFFGCESQIIKYCDIHSKSLNYEFSVVNQSDLLEQIRNCRTEEIVKTADELFDRFRLESAAPEAVLAFLKNFEMELVKLMSEMDVDADGFLPMKIVLDMDMGHMTLERLREHFRTHCLQAAKYLKDAVENQPQSIVNDVKEYIKRNYAEDIKLKNIARLFYINPVYLGQLFSKTTGMQFNEYLNAVRIEEAKRLLRQTDMRISDIASAVGFRNPKYFLSKFKAATNLSPSAFKN